MKVKATDYRQGRLPGMYKPHGKKRRDIEGPIQISIVEFMEWQFPEAITHFCKNELNFRGKTFQRELAKAKKMGAKKGFPDLICIFPDGRIVFFEVKSPDGHPSEDQLLMHAALRRAGHYVGVVRSINDAKIYLRKWGFLQI